MTNEEKQLLLKDLCTRLPYGVKVNYAGKTYDALGYYGNNLIIVLPFMSNLESHPIETCKPYLRPMSSMTEEERYEYEGTRYQTFLENGESERSDTADTYDWLNANCFDYRGLIPMGLAFEAPEGMYNTKTE